MKIGIIISLLSLFPFLIEGQINLVPNPSFEDTFRCSIDSNIVKAKVWFNPTNYGTPDFFYPTIQGNPGCIDQYPGGWGGGAYSNIWGYQLPRSGNAYAGMAVSQGSELMESPLLDSMKMGKSYAVSFYVSVGDAYGSGLDLIGISFRSDSVTDYFLVGYLPGILNNDAGNASGNILIDQLGWMLVQDTFIAIGGERYMILGNIDTGNTQYYNSSNPTAVYFYFDDFDIHCVDCSSSIPPVSDYPEITLTPNPSNGEFILKGNFPPETKMKIYNMLGQLVWSEDIESGNRTVPIFLQLAAGVYVYQVQSPNGQAGNYVLKNGKLVIEK